MPTLPTPLRRRAVPTLRPTQREARVVPVAVARTPRPRPRAPVAVTRAIFPTSRRTDMHISSPIRPARGAAVVDRASVRTLTDGRGTPGGGRLAGTAR